MAERSVAVRLGATVTGYVNNIKAAKATTVDFYTSAIDYGEKHSAQLDSLAMKAGVLGAGMLALSGYAVKAAMDWETAWAGVTKTVDGTPEQLAKIEQGLQDMSAVKPTTAIELAAIAESAGALGVKTEDILSFTSVMADLGESTDLTSEQAATSIAQLMNVMQTAPEDVDNLGAALVDLGNKGASTENQIVQMAQNIAGAAAIVGLSEANVLAIGNALASSGIEVEAGGSAISKVLMDIDKAVATGGAGLEKFAKVAELSAGDFAAKWQADPADALASFVEGLGRMNDRGEDVFSTLDGLGQSDIRVTRALLNMAASGDMLRESLANGDAAWEKNTALAAEAAKRYETTSSQAKMAWNEIKTAAVDAGNGLLPIVSDIAGVVGDAGAAFSALPAPVQTGITAIIGVGGVALIAAAGVTKMITTIATLRAELAALQLSGTAAGAMLGALAKGGAGLAAFWAGAAVGDKVGERNSKSIQELASGLEKLGKSGKATGDLKDLFGEDLSGKAVRFGKDLGSIGDALKSLDGYADDNSLTEAIKFFGSAGQSAGITAQAEALGDLDKAFTVLAKNKPDEAIAAFEEVRDRAIETGASTKDIERAFPTMTSMMQDASKAMGGTSDASQVLDGDLSRLAPAAQQSAEDLAKTQQALDEARSSAIATGQSFLSFSRDAKTSFASYLADLEKGAEAYAAFTENAIEASSRGLDEGFIDELKEQGPAGALLLADFADASEKEIARANRAFRDTRGLADLEAELQMIPEFKVTEFKTPGAKGAIDTAVKVAEKYKMSPDLVSTVLEALDYTKADIKAVVTRIQNLRSLDTSIPIITDISGALTNLSTLQRTINGMNGKTIRVAVKGGTGGGITVDAEGSIHTPNGRITAFGNGGVEDHQAQIGNGRVTRMWNEPETGGEAYIPLATGKRPRSRNIAEQTVGILGGRVEWFAGGGITGVSALDLKSQQRTIRDLERSLREREPYGKKRKGKKRPTRLVLKPGSLDRQIAQLELAEAKKELRDLRSGAAARAERLDTARGNRDSVADGLAGGFGISQFIGQNAFGQSAAASGSAIAGGAKAYAGKVKAFAVKVEKARKLGIPLEMLREIAGLPIDEGLQALDALLSSSSSDIATIKTAYRDIATYANGAGEVIAKAMDLTAAGKDSATGYAKGFITGLGKHASAMGQAANNATKGKKSKWSSEPLFGQPAPQSVSVQWGATPAPLSARTPSTATIASSDVDLLAQSIAAAVAANPLTVTAILALSGRQAVSVTDLAAQTKAKQS